ncbi:MAG TPA: type VI secretion system-associated protein TagO [Gemmatimonadaceae bacterium]|nr:type VI secretion system-associated protein TagO [Gemmatimonadaceae bacterium]
MIPIIGVMIGLYILTRMVELITSSQKPLLRVLGTITALGSAVGITLLTASSTSLADLGSRSSSAASPPSLAYLVDSLTGSSKVSTWEVSQSTNPIDDSPVVTMRLEAVSGHSRFGDSPTLILRCSRKKTDAYIVWNDFLGTDETTVTTRVGKGQALAQSWTLSTDNKATFYPSNVVSFVKSLLQVDTLVARTTPYSESPVTAIFVVTGLKEKIEPLQKACNWT